MSGAPRISVAMATYNGAAFLREQLDSIAAQSRAPDEIVITDDGSSDRTGETIAAFASATTIPVRFHRNAERLGYSRNFIEAIRRCSGEIVFLSDQDDVWFPEKIATVMREFEKPGTMAVLNGQIITDASLNHHGRTMLDNARTLGMGPDRLISACATAVRRDWALLLFGDPRAMRRADDLGIESDRWLNEISVALAVRAFVEQPLQYFRRHGANTTEHIQHQPKGTGVRDLVRLRQDVAPVAAWRRRMAVLDAYCDWLREHRGEVESAGIGTVAQAIASFEAERRGLLLREQLVRKPLPRRILAITSLWRSGGYRYFYGWKSAVRDLARSAQADSSSSE